MKAQDLKNSVLQLAIQGKLVEQNPNDEPASLLLEKISAEKEELIKEKKIKREKPLPKISEAEKPFEIPDTWEWIRLSEIAWLGDGRKIENTNLPYLEVKYLRGSKEAELKDKGKFIEKGQLVILVDGENSGEVFVIGENGYLGSTFKVLNYSMNIYWEYLMWLLRCYQDKFKNNKTGSAIPHLNKTLFKNLPVGLPPLEEQKRIVAKIEEVLEKIEEYDKAEKELSELEKAFPQEMKKSILQYAIQGKLVEQNPNDEPASVLLEKIKAEKEQLIKEKKIKKEKPLPEIREVEKPFDIPDSWEWVRLGDICAFQGGYAYKSNTYVEKSNNQVIRLGNVKNDKLLLDSKQVYISDEIANETEGYRLKNNDILITMTGTRGKRDYFYTMVVNEDELNGVKVYLNQRVGCLRAYRDIEVKLLNIFLKSESILKQIFSTETGTANQGNIGSNNIMNLVIPLPPKEEQKRISDKVELLTQYISKLEYNMYSKSLINKEIEAKTIERENKKELINK